MYTSLKEIIREEKLVMFMLFVFVVEMSLIHFSLTGASEEEILSFGANSGSASAIITRIGDVCDDRNKLTTNDFYINTKGTCEGARVDLVVSKWKI